MEENIELSEFTFAKFKPRTLPGSRQARFCSFGLTAGLAAILVGAGVGAETAGIAATGLIGAGVGATGSAITGGDPLIGALTGGLTGGLTSGFGGDVASGLGIGVGGADALIGAGVGAGVNGLTGSNPLTGALTGGIGGYLSAPGNSPFGGNTSTPTTGTAGGGSSAISGALPGSGLNTTGAVGGAGAAGGGVGTVGGGAGATGIPGLSGNTGGGATGIPGVNPAPAASLTAGGGGGFGSSLLKGLEANPIQAITEGLGLVQGQQRTATLDSTVKQLQTQAGGINNSAAALEAPLSTGILPPGAQQAVTSATNSAKAAIRSKYAQLGLSGSTMETQDLNSVDQQASAQIFQLASDLYKTGVSQQGLSTQLYDAILQAQAGSMTQANNAVTNYAAALAGGNYASKTAA